MTDYEQKYKKLAQRIREIVPYVTATISPGNTFPSTREGWVEVHKGRAFSSHNQLNSLLNMVDEDESGAETG